jgi:hypothetical protein
VCKTLISKRRGKLATRILLSVDGRVILKRNLKKQCKMVWNRVILSGNIVVVGSYEHGNESLGSGKVGDVLGS